MAARGAEVIEVFPTASWTRWQGKRGPRTRAAWTRQGLATLGLIGSGVSSAITGTLAAVLVVIACTIGLAVLGGIAWLVYRVRQDHPGRPIAARPVYQLSPGRRPRLEAPQRPALEPPRNELHLHFHGMNPTEVAEAIRHSTKERVTTGRW